MTTRKTSNLVEQHTNNIVEILEFIISGQRYGINVAKIVELMKHEAVTPMPNSNPYVEGIFKPRDEVMTLINLPAYLGHPESEDVDTDIFIITNLSNTLSAFHVHSVEEIHRILWTDIEKPDAAIYGGVDALATGIARVRDANGEGERLITILDFEMIMGDISPSTTLQTEHVSRLGERRRSERPILLAEDSPALIKLLTECLTAAEYTNLTMCNNGQEAWEILQNYKKSGHPIEDLCALIISDIEMPKMDGHRLLKNIRDDSALKHIPLIIFSSIIDAAMRIKGEKLGATAQISKPEIDTLISLIDAHIL